MLEIKEYLRFGGGVYWCRHAINWNLYVAWWNVALALMFIWDCRALELEGMMSRWIMSFRYLVFVVRCRVVLHSCLPSTTYSQLLLLFYFWSKIKGFWHVWVSLSTESIASRCDLDRLQRLELHAKSDDSYLILSYEHVFMIQAFSFKKVWCNMRDCD